MKLWIGQKIRVIKNEGVRDYFTVGKIYEIVGFEPNKAPLVISDTGTRLWLQASEFQVVIDELPLNLPEWF